jgi:hypothetical protein
MEPETAEAPSPRGNLEPGLRGVTPEDARNAMPGRDRGGHGFGKTAGHPMCGWKMNTP